MIHGKSGSGKTTLARHFVEEVRNETTIWWTSCSAINLSMRLQKLAEMLKIPKDNLAIEKLIDQIRIRLANNKFIFVFDSFDVNCEDQKNILRVIINSDLQINIKFLITAKSNMLSKMFSKKFYQLGLDLLGKDDCLKFIKYQISNLKNEQLNEIVENLEYLPVKINVLVGKIKKMKNFTYQALLEEIQKDIISYYETLEKENQVDYKLLRYLSLLDGQSISIELIRSILIDEDNNEMSETINRLEEISILKTNEVNEYKIHESIQKEIHITLNNEDEKKYIVNRSILAVNNLYKSKDNYQEQNQKKLA